MNRLRRRWRAALPAAVATVLAAGAAGAQGLGEILRIDTQANRDAATSQQRIDRISDDTQKMLDEFRAVSAQIDTLRDYNAQLAQLISSQERELASLSSQLNEVTVIQRKIMPLMSRMIDALEEFIELDIPFLLTEREERVQKLRELMDRADVDPAEKYRRVMEAYQIENDYGRTVEDYRGTLDVEDRTLTVDFLKVGRVAFTYLTLDGSEAGVWNQAAGAWEDASDFRGDIRNGLRMARDQMAKDRLLTLPIPAPTAPERTVARKPGEETEI